MLSLVWSELQPHASSVHYLKSFKPPPPTHNFIRFDIAFAEEQEAL